MRRLLTAAAAAALAVLGLGGGWALFDRIRPRLTRATIWNP